ncbi:MAG: hypothetical protein JNK37_17730 [Verrucomicrobiales bacterium]|nr:hypothetical protein [Verrucomicrobiales bacterium]
MQPPGDDHDLRSHPHDDEEPHGEGAAWPVPPIRGPIPEVLWSFYEERPFKTCTRCGEGLVDLPEGYRVSKVIREGEVIFEYALCVPCLQGLMNEASEESKQRLMEFQMSRFRHVHGFDECALCDNQAATMAVKEYGLVGICLGAGLAESNLICGECMEAMSECLSEQTRRSWDRFVEENFPGVPADFEPVPSIGPVPVF